MAHRLDAKPKIIPTERLEELCRQYRADVDRVETVHEAVLREVRDICIEAQIPQVRMMSLLNKIEYMLPRYPLLAATEQYLMYNRRALVKRRLKEREKRGLSVDASAFAPSVHRVLPSPFDHMSPMEIGKAAVVYGEQAKAITAGIAKGSIGPQNARALPMTEKREIDQFQAAQEFLKRFPGNPPLDAIVEQYQDEVRIARAIVGLDEDGKDPREAIERNRRENRSLSAQIDPKGVTKQYALSNGDGVKITGASAEYKPQAGLFTTKALGGVDEEIVLELEGEETTLADALRSGAIAQDEAKLLRQKWLLAKHAAAGAQGDSIK